MIRLDVNELFVGSPVFVRHEELTALSGTPTAPSRYLVDKTWLRRGEPVVLAVEEDVAPSLQSHLVVAAELVVVARRLAPSRP